MTNELLKTDTPTGAEAIVSCLETLLEDGYKVTFDSVDVGATVDFEAHAEYVVTVSRGDKEITMAQHSFLVDAMADAYGSTPEVKR